MRMQYSFLGSLALVAMLNVFSSAAQAQQSSINEQAAKERAISDSAATEQVKARLISALQQVEPGQSLTLGLQQQIIPHWHTYWLNPGDSGNPTTIDWHLPEGSSAAEIEWPTPGRTIVGPITNYSYSDEVTLLSQIQLPDNLQPGSTVELGATVDWLVCEEECIPQTVELALTLPVVGKGLSTAAVAADLQILANAKARLPVAAPFTASATATKEGFTLRLAGLAGFNTADNPLLDLYFYPQHWGVLAQSSPQHWQQQGNDYILQLPKGEVPPASQLQGVLVVQTKLEPESANRGYLLNIAIDNPPATAVLPAFSAASTTTTDTATPGLLLALLLAFGGGLILNLMPCVFPVLSIKALSLLQQQQFGAAVQRRQGWIYTGGILVSFVALAAIILAFKAAGQQVGWGFQFQSPLFVLGIAYLLFAVGLSLSGVYHVGLSLSGVGQELTEAPGYRGTFFTGVLATIVATPCTAPLMAAALGYALTQPPMQLILVFLALGFGLAFPVLLLSYWPALQRALPKPGAWMDTLKQLLAFPIYAAVIWLIWVLALQQGADAVLVALSGLLLLMLAAWWYQHSRFGSNRAQWLGSTAAIALVLTVLVVSQQQLSAASTANPDSLNTSNADQRGSKAKQSASYPFEPYSDARLAELRAQGKPVFVNFTAAWCISCLVNEKVALSSQQVTLELQRQNIVYLKADWTERDEAIRQTLAAHGRSGVPLYLYYPAGSSQALVLPQILTPELVVSTLTQPAIAPPENSTL